MKRPAWLSRRPKDEGTPETISYTVPWWVSVFTDVGRPLAAVVVLVLCAPGEQHLAELAGWRGWLSWGMAGLFSMYAGIAAVVATVRPPGAPGKRSAVWGAAVSLMLAMGAQPVSHLFVTGWMTADPRPPVWIVATVSCVPPFILGHLLHLASSPVSRPVRGQDTPSAPVATVTRLRPRPVPSPVPASSPAPVSRPAVPAAVPRLSLTKGQSSGQTPGQRTGQQLSLSSRALELLRDGTDEDKVRDILRAEFTSPAGVPPKANTISKSVNRAKERLGL